MQLLEQLDLVAVSDPERRRRPLAHTVDGEDRRLLERRGEERARGVRFVMLGVTDLAFVPEGAADLAIEKQLLLHPQRSGQTELRKAAGRDAQIGLEDTLELEQRLVVEPDVREVARGDATGREAVPHGVRRKRLVTLLAGEALLLGGGDDVAVSEQARRAVVIEGREAEDVRGCHGIQSRSGAPDGKRRATQTAPGSVGSSL